MQLAYRKYTQKIHIVNDIKILMCKIIYQREHYGGVGISYHKEIYAHLQKVINIQDKPVKKLACAKGNFLEKLFQKRKEAI